MKFVRAVLAPKSLRGEFPLLLLPFILCLAGSAAGQGWQHKGKLVPEWRYFLESGKTPQALDHSQASLRAEVELDWQSENGKQAIRFTPYVRLDTEDSERSHIDIRELNVQFREGDWQLSAGINKLYWGVSESRHLVDIINQTDNLDDIDGEDKLGQPMIALSFHQDWGSLEAFYLPVFREQKFPGPKGRLGPGVPLVSKAIYKSSSGKHHKDIALRYSHTLGDFDIGAYWFDGTDRQPTFTQIPDSDFWAPTYTLIKQVALDLQYTHEAWLWKLEALRRERQGDNFYAFVGGFEYTYYQMGSGRFDLGVLMEYLYDGRDERDSQVPITLFQNDLFLGLRMGFHDTQNTALLAGVMSDLGGEEHSLMLEFERRMSPRWFMAVEGRFFQRSRASSPQRVFDGDSFLTLSVSRYF